VYIFDVLIIIVIIIIYLYQETTSLKLEKMNLKSDKINSNIKILQISDLHLKQIGRLEKRVIDKINNKDFDILVITGDYLYKRDTNYFSELERFLDKLNYEVPVVAILGDGDYKTGLSKLRNIITDFNITLLENDSLSLEIKDNKINIIGVGSPDLNYHNLPQAVSSINLDEGYNLLLSHTYDIIDSISPYMNIDLILVGDTHGGQINIPLIGEKVLKSLFNFEYLKGKYDINGTVLYVNRGIGTSKLNVRLRCRPEIALIEVEGRK